MTVTAAKKKSRLILICLLICFIAIAAYRYVLINSHISKYIDEDQALMWYGTALASHGGIREPHFLGQKYGSMIESIAAVPLYKAGVPLEWALPLTTFAIWIFPFVYCAVSCRKKMPVVSLLIAASAMVYHWDYDILTNIPRSFIGGFPFAFLGVGLMISEKKQGFLWTFLSVLLCGLAYEATVTSIAVSAFGVLYLLLYNPSRLKQDWQGFLAGAAAVILMVCYCDSWFYQIHPEYGVFGRAESLDLSLKVLMRNIKRVPFILKSFSFICYNKIPVSFILGAMAALVWIGKLIKQKDYRFLLVAACAFLGSVAFLMVRRTENYSASMYMTAARLYLFGPYVIITVLYLYARKTDRDFSNEEQWIIFEKWQIPFRSVLLALTAAVVLLSCYKAYDFETKVLNDSKLYGGNDTIHIYSVADIYELADELKSFSETNSIDIFISMNDVSMNELSTGIPSLGYDYGASAINYGEYKLYRPAFERRTDVYFALKEKEHPNEKVAFFTMEGNRIDNYEIVILQDTDCISYVEELTGIRRIQKKIG